MILLFWLQISTGSCKVESAGTNLYCSTKLITSSKNCQDRPRRQTKCTSCRGFNSFFHKQLPMGDN